MMCVVCEVKGTGDLLLTQAIASYYIIYRQTYRGTFRVFTSHIQLCFENRCMSDDYL